MSPNFVKSIKLKITLTMAEFRIGNIADLEIEVHKKLKIIPLKLSLKRNT